MYNEREKEREREKESCLTVHCFVENSWIQLLLLRQIDRQIDRERERERERESETKEKERENTTTTLFSTSVTLKGQSVKTHGEKKTHI